MNGNLSPFQRFLLAFIAFFWVLFDRRFAEGVHALRERTRELPPAGPAPAPEVGVKPVAPAEPVPTSKEVGVVPKEPAARRSEPDGARPKGPAAVTPKQPDLPPAADAAPAAKAAPEPARPAPKLVEAARPPSPAVAPQPAPELVALTVLGTLQRDGRLVDFLSEDLDGFSDSEIGAAARTVHAGCRKTLAAYVALEPIYREPEGATVVVAPGFDATAIRVTGNVVGDPPFRGALRHHGWRATRATFPPIPTGHDPHLIAPAEVELT